MTHNVIAFRILACDNCPMKPTRKLSDLISVGPKKEYYAMPR